MRQVLKKYLFSMHLTCDLINSNNNDKFCIIINRISNYKFCIIIISNNKSHESLLRI